jgi:class 3 adenylate cyclase/CheY-like chemotaxis protein
MASILVVEDDPATREVLTLYLQANGHKVTAAEDGLQGLQKALSIVPDLIVSDVNMPNLDGFGLLSAVRGNVSTTTVPFIFLTMFDDRETFRRAMGLGANDLINKPIKRDELLETVNARLARASTRHTTLTQNSLAMTSSVPTLRSSQGGVRAPLATTSMRAMREEPLQHESGDASTKETRHGTVLFSDVRNYTTICERLSPDEVGEMMNAFFSRACEPIMDQNGWVVKFLGDGIVAMFDSYASAANDHAERAIKASLLMVAAARRFKSWIDQRFRGRGLPDFGIGIGINTGDVLVCKIGSGPNAETTILGDTVNLASRLEAQTKELGWSIVAALSTVMAAGPRFLVGRRGTVDVKGRVETVDIVEVTGLAPRPGTPDNQLVYYNEIQEAIAANTAVASERLHATMAQQHHMTPEGRFVRTQQQGASFPIQIEGYHLEKKLGEGGMSKVYLAMQVSSGEQHVLKVLTLNLDDEEEQDAVQRFIQEYALLSQVQHPNVATIYGHGFTESHAYISMEYFSGGDLRGEIKAGLSVDRAINYMVQTTRALAAIHEIGIVHRDLKPDNLMLRSNGSLALADFGIAKQISTMITKTRHGEVFGTPYYLSPEQALGRQVDPRSDLYSLGIMFYEMLTGDKPYHADDPQALLFKHVHGDLPVLPSNLAKFQPVLNKLLAKQPGQRFASAAQALAGLQPYLRDLNFSLTAPQTPVASARSNPAWERTQPIARS